MAKLATLDVLAPGEAQRLLQELPVVLADDPAGERRQAWRTQADSVLRDVLPRQLFPDLGAKR